MRALWRKVTTGLAALTALGAAWSATAADAPVKIRAGYIPVLGSSQLFVMDQEGWAKEAGLDLELIRFDSGPAMIQGLASGKLDALYAGVTPMLVAYSRGFGVEILAASATEEIVLAGRGPIADAMAAHPNDAAGAFAAFAKSQNRKVKIGSQPPGSVPETVTNYWLKQVAKVSPDHVEVLSMGIEKTQQALLVGAIDAAPVREPAITLLRDSDPAVLVLVDGAHVFPGQPGGVLAARAEARKDQPAAFDKLVALHVRATKLLQTDTKRAAQSVHAHIGKGLADISVIERALASPHSKYIADPRQILPAVEVMQQFQVAQGSMDKAADLSKAFVVGPYLKAAQ